MDKRYAIFDMDGTLVDSMAYWKNLASEYLKSKGIPQIPPDLLNKIRPMTMTQSAALFIREFHLKETPETITAEMNALMDRHYRNDIPLKPGVHSYLEQLHRSGTVMCVASAAAEPLMRACLRRLGVEQYFQFLLSCEQVGAGKTRPDVYFAAAERLDAKPEEIAVYEDALYAAKTAKEAGFYVAGVYDDSASNHREELKELADEWIGEWDSSLCQKGTDMKTALTIAGSDSSGGAGIQADIKTMTMNGVYAMSAITALTAQNTVGVRAIQESSPDFLKQQIDAVFEDIRPDAVKIGMVSSRELIHVISERLRCFHAENIVVDPVMIATSGSSLMKNDAVQALMKELLPISTLVTPNIPEAEVLSGRSVETKEDMMTAAKKIGDDFHCAVLLKGGHSINDANDLLYANGSFTWFEGRRIDNPNTHGTGCTLSGAIASNLAKGFTLSESIQRAKDYISGALAAMLDLGQGSGPLNHAFDLQGEFAKENVK